MTQNNEFPKYELATVNDFLKIPEDKLDLCFEEFKRAIETHKAMEELMRATTKAILECRYPDKPVEEIDAIVVPDVLYATMPSFTWVDDGRRDIGVKVSTMEVKE